MLTKLNTLLSDSIRNVGVAAMLLALTSSIRDEEVVKQAVASLKHKFVVTEIGGKSVSDTFQEKVNHAVIAASVNSSIIDKVPNEIHAIVHATEEAKRGILINTSSSASLALKIAIVRDEHWIAVAMFGKSALHYMTNHERAGLGVMHI